MNKQQKEEHHGFQKPTLNAVSEEARSAYEKYQVLHKFTGSMLYYKASMLALDLLIDLNQLEMEHLQAESVLFERTCEKQKLLRETGDQQELKVMFAEVESIYEQRDDLDNSDFLKAVGMYNHFRKQIQTLVVTVEPKQTIDAF